MEAHFGFPSLSPSRATARDGERKGTRPEDHEEVCARTGVHPSGNMGGLTCALTCTKPGEQLWVPSHRVVGRDQRNNPDQRATKNWGGATAETHLDGVLHGRIRGQGGEKLRGCCETWNDDG